MFILLGLLLVQTPCFDYKVEVEPQYVLQIQVLHDGELVTVIDRGGFVNTIQASACGLGDWEIQSRTGTECIELENGMRIETGKDCVWEAWQTTVTANVGTADVLPGSPTLFVVNREPPD